MFRVQQQPLDSYMEQRLDRRDNSRSFRNNNNDQQRPSSNGFRGGRGGMNRGGMRGGRGGSPPFSRNGSSQRGFQQQRGGQRG